MIDQSHSQTIDQPQTGDHIADGKAEQVSETIILRDNRPVSCPHSVFSKYSGSKPHQESKPRFSLLLRQSLPEVIVAWTIRSANHSLWAFYPTQTLTR